MTTVLEKAAELLLSGPVGGMVKVAEPLSREEKKNVRKTLKVIRPRSRTDEQVQEIAGRPWTAGQMARRGVIGAGGGIAAGTLQGLITGAPLTVGRAVKKGTLPSIARGAALLSPRRLAAGGIGGATFGLAIPLIQQMADREAAKRGQF